MKLPKYLLLLPLVFSMSTVGQIIKLDYQPQGRLVKFYFLDYQIITDTSAIYSIRDSSDGIYSTKDYSKRIRHLIESKHYKDTIVFKETFVPFNDSVGNSWETDKYWRVWNTIRKLIVQKKAILIDSSGSVIKEIKIKKLGNRRNGMAYYFVNKETKKELFLYKEVYIRMGEILLY